MSRWSKSSALRALKRLVDIVAAATGLALLGPLLVVLTLVSALAHGWPPWFVQSRAGLHGRVFNMFKMRSMSDARDKDGELLPDVERLTRIGHFMRAASLDELPGLWNVLRGDMSLVGPRPLLVRYLERYSPEQARRHEMPPGITGWAQINGRNTISWEQKFEYDVWYVDHWTPWLDVKILFATIGKVLRRADITARDSATMYEFMGSSTRFPEAHE